MLFLISWSIPCDKRVACFNVFGKMTPEDDLKDAGEHIKIHGRWHRLSGSSGVCIAECSDSSHLNSWMMNWAPICDISVEPVVDDATSRSNIRTKPFYTAGQDNSSSEESAPVDESSKSSE